MSALASPKPATFVGPHSSIVADFESSLEDVVEASIDDDVVGKKVAVRSSDPQSYRDWEVVFTNLHRDEVQNPLGADLQKRKNEFAEFLRAKEN